MSKRTPKRNKNKKPAKPNIKKNPSPTSSSSLNTDLNTEAQTYNNLGITFSKQGKFAEAILFYQRALALEPNYVTAYYNLGNAFKRVGKISEAIEVYQRALALNPHSAEMHLNLGNIFQEQGQFAKAIASYQQALILNPNYLEAHYNQGIALSKQGKIDEAIKCYQYVLTLNANDVEAHNNLGIALGEQGKIDQAINCYQRALTLNPNYAQAHYNLGNAFCDQGQIVKAMTCYQQAVSFNPRFAEAYNNLGNVLKDQGKIGEALSAYQQSVAINPNSALVHSNLLYTLNYLTEPNPATLFHEHQKFNEQHVDPLNTYILPHGNTRDLQRKLKIGYVSADFRQHSLIYFIEPILAHHDHQQFEIFCYYNHTKHDEFTERLQPHIHQWLNCTQLSDDSLAQQIRADQIDILVDLAGHTAGNRLPVFGRKPAPIQMTYLGYVNTTGMTVIDYRIVDNHTDPQGKAEPFLSETPLRMPDNYCCYNPLDDTPLNTDPPRLKNGYFTFGSFNNYAKLSAEITAIWVKVLHAIPDSKLVVKTKSLQDPVIRQTFLERFTSLGIDPARLDLGYFSSTEETMTHYNQIDIALDSYSYNGCTTTGQALWMGVPVVTLVGETHASRVGLSFLSTLELTRLIAYNPEKYVAICVELSNDIDYLKKLRVGMRARMQASPLMDAMTFTRHLEAAYRSQWKKWCTQ